MYEDEDQSFMLLVLGVLAAVLMTVLWYVISDDDGAAVNTAVAAVEQSDDAENAAGSEEAAADADAEDGHSGDDAMDDADEGAMDDDGTDGDAMDDDGTDGDTDGDAMEEAPAPTAAPEPAPEAAEPEVTEPVVPAADLDPVELTITATDATITLEGLVSDEAIRQGIVEDATAIVGADNVTNLLEVDAGRSLESGIITTLLGEVTNEDRAVRLRKLAGIGTQYELSSDDQLVVSGAAAVPEDTTEDTGTEDTGSEDTGTEGEQAAPANSNVADQLAQLFAFNPIQFASGSAIIQETSFGPLNEAALTLTDNPGVSVSVEGHTDSQGNAGANQTLSQNRAEAVVNYLVSQGVNPDQLTAAGFGADNPIADNATAEGRAENRRIEFVQTGG